MTHHTDQERIGGYEDCHPVNQGSNITYEALQQAVTFLDLQRNRVQYPMDEQLKTQKQIAEFIKRWQCTKNTR